MNKNEAQTGSLPDPHVGPLGERGLLFTFTPQQEQAVPLSVQQRVWALSAWLEERRQELRLHEIVPGMGNLLVVADPSTSGHASLADTLLSLWPTLRPLPGSGRTVEIPVHYGSGRGEDGDDDGPDLALVAAHTGLSVAEIIHRHSEATYQVYCLGFQPGFAYLAGLDPSLATPRRESPRVRTPAGSVAIGGNQTGIYPSSGPGGWQIIGRTSLVLFDPNRDSPSLLQPGDSVRFVPGGSS